MAKIIIPKGSKIRVSIEGKLPKQHFWLGIGAMVTVNEDCLQSDLKKALIEHGAEQFSHDNYTFPAQYVKIKEFEKVA